LPLIFFLLHPRALRSTLFPYTTLFRSVAKMVTSLAFLHGRRVYLNMVAGGFTNDLAALNDHTPHDERYSRLGEYTVIIQGLLASDRKSTRLNSSHVAISYAVFCLKKKN